MSHESVFVIVLKERAEREYWGFEGFQVAITVPLEGVMEKLTLTQWRQIDPSQFRKPCVIVYSDHALDENHAESKSKLRKLAGDSVRVWDHGGQFDLKVCLDEVHRRFDEKGFKDADFTREVPVMPFSTRTAFPWMKIFEHVQAGISQTAKESKEKTPDAKELLDDLEAAWNTAVCYFTIEQPAKCLLEALFPLYVDLTNHQLESLTKTDLCATFAAAKEELESRLAQLRHPLETKAKTHVESLKIRFNLIKDYPECDPQKLAEPGWVLLGALERLSATHGIQEFIHMFTLFSEAYTSSLELETQTAPTGAIATNSPS